MNEGRTTPCPLAQLHDFVPLLEDGKLIAIICIHCGAGAEERDMSDIHIAPDGTLVPRKTKP